MRMQILTSTLLTIGKSLRSRLAEEGDSIDLFTWRDLKDCPLLYDYEVIVLDLDVRTEERGYFHNHFYEGRIRQEVFLALKAGRTLLVLAHPTIEGVLSFNNYSWIRRRDSAYPGISGDSVGTDYVLDSEELAFQRYFEGVTRYYKTFVPTSTKWRETRQFAAIASVRGTEIPIAIEYRVGSGMLVFLPPSDKSSEEAIDDLYELAKYYHARSIATAPAELETEEAAAVEVKELVESVDQALSLLRNDLQFFGGISTTLVEDQKASLGRMESKFASANKRIIVDDEMGLTELQEIFTTVWESRLESYRRATDLILQSVKAELDQAFWFGDKVSILQRLSEIEKRVQVINAQAVSGEYYDVLIAQYKDQIDSIKRILGNLRSERGRARFSVPLKVILWGLPIVVGLLFSNASSTVQYGSLIALMVIAILSYFVVGRRTLERIVTSKFRVVISALAVLLVLSVLGYLAKDSLLRAWSAVSTTKIDPKLIVAAVAVLLPIMLSAVLFTTRDIREILAKRRLRIGLPQLKTKISPGSAVKLPFTLTNIGSLVIAEVTLGISAPGLLLQPRREKLFKAIGAKESKNSIITLEIPEDVPNGEYMMQLEWNFYLGTERYKKRSRLRIDVGT